MDTINKKQKIILIALGVLVLIVLGFFYLKTNKIAESPVVEMDDTTNTDVSTNPEGEVVSDTALEVGNTGLVNTEDSKKFNLAFENGSKAFLAQNYDQAIAYYKQALDYKDSDFVYIRLFSAYNAQNNIDQARLALEKAISINPNYTDYWITKLTFLNEKTNISFLDLKAIYQEGLQKVDSKTKINLITSFANIAENNKQNAEAIALWEYAKEVYPQNAIVYQGEIDRIKAL